MKDTDYNDLVELTPVGGGFLPVNQNAQTMLEMGRRGEVIAFREVTARDLSFHRAYFALLRSIYAWTTPAFKQAISEQNFYQFLKHLQGQYEVLFEFQDGSKMIEYKSISFGRMSQKSFEDYVREQLPVIYEDVIMKLYDGDTASRIISSIEEEFEKFLAQL